MDLVRMLPSLENRFTIGVPGIDTSELFWRFNGHSRRLHSAWLELAVSPEERLDARQSLIDISLRVEKFCEANRAVGKFSELDHLEAKSYRIEAEIELLKERDALQRAPRRK